MSGTTHEESHIITNSDDTHEVSGVQFTDNAQHHEFVYVNAGLIFGEPFNEQYHGVNNGQVDVTVLHLNTEGENTITHTVTPLSDAPLI